MLPLEQEHIYDFIIKKQGKVSLKSYCRYADNLWNFLHLKFKIKDSKFHSYFLYKFIEYLIHN